MAKRTRKDSEVGKAVRDSRPADYGGSDARPNGPVTPRRPMPAGTRTTTIDPRAGASFDPRVPAPMLPRGEHPGNVPGRGRPQLAPNAGLRGGAPNAVASNPVGPVNPNARAIRYGNPDSESRYADWRPHPPRPAIFDVDMQSNWFSPFQPIYPFAPPQVPPRTWDYPTGINLEIHRRIEVCNFLRALAKAGDGVLAPVIRSRKDQLLRVPHEFHLKDRPDADDPRIEELDNFFRCPDGEHDFETWFRMLLQDRFVIDAATLMVWKRENGKPYRINVIDGASIQVLCDDAGRIPDPPDPAFAQIIKGLPMSQYTKDEIIYSPYNTLPEAPIYGWSEVQDIMLRIASAVRKELYVFDQWTEGNIPDMIMGTPDTWTPEQVGNMQAFFDTLLSGNLALKTKVRFMPGGVKPVLAKGTTAEILAALEKFEERTARIICFNFSISPVSFVSMMNRATAANLSDEAATEGLYPLIHWSKNLMDRIIREWWGYEDIEFVWQVESDVDPDKQSQTLRRYVDGGIMTRNEARDTLSLPPDPDGDVLMVTAGAAVTPLKLLVNPPPPPAPKPGLPGAQPPKQIGQNGNGQRALPAPEPKPAEAESQPANGNGKPKRALIPEADFVKVGKWLLPVSEL